MDVMERSPDVLDVTDESFAAEVVEESRRRPVVVDFWAAWCAPCRVLGPILERLAEEASGSWRLARVDVDRNPVRSAEFGVQGIPAVKAFVVGRLADEFVGALPEPLVREWLARFVPGPGDDLLDEAVRLEEAGHTAAAIDRYREVLEADPGSRPARLGLGRMLLASGNRDRAAETLRPLLPDPDAQQLLSRAEIAGWADAGGGGAVADAKHMAAEGRFEEALAALIDALATDAEGARSAAVEIFRALGEDDPRTREYRRKLSAALF